MIQLKIWLKSSDIIIIIIIRIFVFYFKYNVRDLNSVSQLVSGVFTLFRTINSLENFIDEQSLDSLNFEKLGFFKDTHKINF